MVDKDAMLMRCGRCLQQVPLKQMKYAKDGRTLVCLRCRGLGVQEHLDRLRRKEAGHDASPPVSRTRYACTDCGFTFSRGNLTPKQCPYCGKERVVPQETISGAGLLDEADDLD